MDTSIPDSPADPYPAVGPDWLLWPQRSAELARQKVIVLGGGTSDEREVSLRSAEAMAAALGGLSEHQCTALPASLQTVEIDATGHWVVAGRALDRNTALEQLHPDGLFFLADMQDGFVSFTQFLFLFTEQMRIPASAVTPAVNAVYVPIVEDGGSSVLSAETLAVHSLFAQFLSEINHDWIASQAGRYDEGRNSLEWIASKEVGCNALFIVVL